MKRSTRCWAASPTAARPLPAQHGKRVPIFVKIAPDLDDAQIDVIAATLKRHAMDGVVAHQHDLSRDAVKGLRHAEETNGFPRRRASSGSQQPRDPPAACRCGKTSIIGVGGVMSGLDTVSEIKAGADVVRMHTGLIYKGPALVAEAANSIKNSHSKIGTVHASIRDKPVLEPNFILLQIERDQLAHLFIADAVSGKQAVLALEVVALQINQHVGVRQKKPDAEKSCCAGCAARKAGVQW